MVHAGAEEAVVDSITSDDDPIRVMVVDDHAILVEGLEKVFNEPADTKVVATANSGEEAIANLSEIDCDVCILDISMPGMGGIEALKDIKVRYPTVGVLVLSMHDEREYGFRCIRAGADGYLTKGATAETLLEAVRKIASGQTFISPGVATELAKRARMTVVTDRPHELLSEREYEVFMRLVVGESVTRIGQDLSLSVKTISTYRSRILQKLGLEHNIDLTMYALRNGLIREGQGINQ